MRFRAWCGAFVVPPLLLVLGGCAGDEPPPAPPSPPPSAISIVPGAQGSFNGTDVAWIQLMIPMTEQVTPMLSLGAERARAAPMRDLAARLRDQHQAEAAELRTLLTRTGLPDDNPHEGHDMPGMVTAAEVSALATAQGAAFDESFGSTLRDYLQQVAKVSTSESKVGTDTETTALAARIAAARERDLAALEAARP